jgi:hypothetical protein
MEKILNRLESQRRRLRNLFLGYGVMQVAVRFFMLGIVLFLLDYALDIPRGMRLTLGAAALVYMGFALHRFLIYPMGRSFSREDIALAVERRFTELDGSLISALQFHDLDVSSEKNVSPALVEAAKEDAARRAESVSWGALLDSGPVKKLSLAAAVLLFIMIAFVVIQPGLAAIWVQRSVGGAVNWPRATTLLICLEERGENFKVLSEGDPYRSQEVLIARGTSLPIRIRVEGRDPGEVRVAYEAGSTGFLKTQANRRGEGEYWYRFRNVREDIRFRVEGGDDSGKDRSVDVTVLVPPQVVAVRTDYFYPDYLNLAPETRESSQIEGPEGTRVEAAFTLSEPAASARITVRSSQGEQDVELSADPEDPGVLRHTFELDQSGTYQVRLLSDEGFANVDAPFHSILVKKDQEPRVKLYVPRRRELDVGPRGVVVFRAVATDDYGVAAMRLKYKAAGEDAWESHEFLAEEVDAPYGSRRIGAGHVLDFDLAELAVAGARRSLDRGDSMLYSIEAEDSRPDRAKGRTDTGQYVINIVSDNEKIRILTELQIRLKEDIRSLRELQADRLEKTETAAAASREEPLSEQELISLEVGQSRLTNRYQSAAKEIAYIFDGYLFNRIDKTAAASAFLERAVALRLAQEPRDSFDPGLYTALLEVYASGELGEMDLMERLSLMLGMSLSLSETLSPEAARALASAVVAAGTAQLPDLLETSLEKQRRIVTTLDQLLVKMDEWEDYQELLQLFRDVIDSQNNLNILMREELRSRK